MTANQQPSSPSRLHVVDALRGFAIISIMLLHNLEHFDFYFLPEGLPSWMVAIDKVIWDTMFFLFGGKSYAIFAFLFGLTFFIQSDNQAKRGKDFRGRFAWRLVLLLGFGILNSAFYQGDILTIYALIGFFLELGGNLLCQYRHLCLLLYRNPLSIGPQNLSRFLVFNYGSSRAAAPKRLP